MKKALKKLKFDQIYWKIHPFVCSCLVRISPNLANRFLYRLTFGRAWNKAQPTTFNDKIIWYKSNWSDPRLVQCTDKFLVRDYVEKLGFGYILNEIFHVYDDISEIDWETLPNQFALKCTHGCGCNIICPDKKKLDEKATLKKLAKWMNTDYSRFMGEMHYKKIKPRILCEKFLGGSESPFAKDFKFYCFDGDIKLVLICTNRESKLTLTFRDLEWKIMHVNSPKWRPEIHQEQPATFEEMKSIATEISKGIPFVRVDFYEYKNRPIFGEMTFTPAGGFAGYYSLEGDRLLGDLLTLPGKRL